LKLVNFIFLFLSSICFYGQESEDSIKKEILTIGIGPQLNTFFGDISPNSASKIFVNSRPAITFDFEKRFGNVIGVQMMVIKGKLADHYYPKSFMTKFLKSNLNLILNTDNYFDNKHNFSIYTGLGVGIIKYNAFSDMINNNPNATDPNAFDYDYETELNDGITLLAPFTIGFKWKINPYIQGRVYGTYNLLLTDEIDNQVQGSNDQYASLGFSLNYAFHKITKIKKEKIDIDLEKFDLNDEDNDGVIDLEDKCHHTPKKVKVDSKGCPQDTDEDGVPDYLDIEPKSKNILHVDEQGRSLTDSLIYFRTHITDSIEVEKNQTFSIDTTTIQNIKIDSTINSLPVNDSLKKSIPIKDTIKNNEMNYNPIINTLNKSSNNSVITEFIPLYKTYSLVALKED
jgi:hypothetical protein